MLFRLEKKVRRMPQTPITMARLVLHEGLMGIKIGGATLVDMTTHLHDNSFT